MKKFLLSLASLVALPAMAQTFDYEGIIYEVYDPGFLTCIAADGNDTMNYISGDVVIPETVMYKGEEYTVIGIGTYSFFYADEFYQQPWTLSLPNTVIYIDEGAFWHCEYLTSVKFSENLSSIGYSAFSHCFSLGNVNLPDALTFVDDWAFYSNHSMTEIILPPNLTSTGIYAFCGPRGNSYAADIYDGGKVEKIFIPAGFDELNQRAFGYQPDLKEVYCYATTPPVLTSAPFNHSSTEDAVLYVPASAKGDYLASDSWMYWEWTEVAEIAEEYPDAGVDFTFDSNAPARYFDLNGRAVNDQNLKPGIYVVRQGDKSFKRVVR